MNKCIRQNWKIFNHISFRPIELDEPTDINNINEWCERVWSHLVDDDLKRLAFHTRKGKKGYTISVWADDDYVYLVQVIRSEYNTDETTIMATHKTEANVSDFLAIAKFIHKNNADITGHAINGAREAEKIHRDAVRSEVADAEA